MTINKLKYHKKFSLGYNGQKDFLKRIILPFQPYISSVYSSPVTSMGPSSARFTPDVPPSELLKLRENLKSVGIEFNLVFNFDGISNHDVIDRLIRTANFFGPDVITVSGTFLIDKFIELTEYKLNISIINDINSLNQLYQIFERDPGNQIVSYNIGRRKTYDLEFIRSVRTEFPKLNLKLMVNEGCIFECPDQNFHSCSETMNHGKQTNKSIFYCAKLKQEQRWRFLTGQYIPPKFLANYCNMVDEFKLATRGVSITGFPNDFVIELLREYLEEKDISIARAMRSSFGGSLFAKQHLSSPGELDRQKYQKTYPEDFFSIRSRCKHNCYQCAYCKNILN